MKRILCLLLAVVLAASCCGCGKKAKEPVVYENYETAETELFKTRLYLGQEYYHTPEPGKGKTVLTMVLAMTYLGKEGKSFALGNAGDQPYVRFFIQHGDYVFEEYEMAGNRGTYTGKSALTRMNSGDVKEDVECLRFEPMEEPHRIQLWMIVPEEILDHQEDGLYLAVDINGETILYDIGCDIDWDDLFGMK